MVRTAPAGETPYQHTYPGGKLRGTPVKERLLRRTHKAEDGCWYFDGARKDNGYGVIGVHQDGKHTVRLAHRVSYEEHIGPIPAGVILDHTCSHKTCVNPDHLQQATHAENNQAAYDRGERSVTTCKWGHELTEENTATVSTGRQCRRCRTIRSRARRAGTTMAEEIAKEGKP